MNSYLDLDGCLQNMDICEPENDIAKYAFRAVSGHVAILTRHTAASDLIAQMRFFPKSSPHQEVCL